jgi:predicted DsbA family dithiol-disulfide isomerase
MLHSMRAPRVPRKMTVKGDTNAFKQMHVRRQASEGIGAEARYAQSLGISETPTFIFGKTEEDSDEGRMIVGAVPFDNFAIEINEAPDKH